MNLILFPITGIALNAVALFALTKLVDGITYTGGLKFFVLGGIVMGLINFIIRPILKTAAFPLILVTGGVFLMIINVFVLWFFGYFINALDVSGVSLAFSDLETYVIGAIVFGVINWIVHLIFK